MDATIYRADITVIVWEESLSLKRTSHPVKASHYAGQWESLSEVHAPRESITLRKAAGVAL